MRYEFALKGYTDEDIYDQLGDVATAAVATGLANAIGNKGACALRCS